MKLTATQLRRIIKEEVQKQVRLSEGIATLGLAQKIVSEYDEDVIRDFLTRPEPVGCGFYPDEIGDNLEEFLTGLTMKDLNALEAHLMEKFGTW